MEIFKLQVLPVDQGKDSAGGSNHDVGGLLWVFEQLNILVDWHTAVKSGASDLLEVLRESIELLLDLVRKLSRVAENEGASWLRIILVNLVEDGKDEDGGLSHSGDSLAKDVLTGHGCWDALLLDLGRMLETALGDGS